MNLTEKSLQTVCEAMASRGVHSIVIREEGAETAIEIKDPIHTVESLAELTTFSVTTIRRMEQQGILHAIRSKGTRGDLRFRQSRVYADLKRAEDMKKRIQH